MCLVGLMSSSVPEKGKEVRVDELRLQTPTRPSHARDDVAGCVITIREPSSQLITATLP